MIEIRKLGGNKVDKLRVAKWENAFESVGGTIQVKNDFYQLDPDRFYVRVLDAAANTDPAARDTIKVRVSTTSDTGNDIVLEETDVNTGQFISKTWLLLTSVGRDDAYQVGGIGDNAEGDPTFLVKLDDTVTATYGTKTATATVPTFRVVKLYINILRDKKEADGGMPVVPGGIPTVQWHVKWANDIYASVGIRFDATIQIVDPPDGVDLSNDFDRFTTLDAKKKAILTAEEKALLGAAALRTAAKDDIEVYYVNTHVPAAEGISYIASQMPDAKYVDSLVIKAGTDSQTLSHEIGHVLMDWDGNGHLAGNTGVNKVNLMAVPFQWDGTVTDSRRINAPAGDPKADAQAGRMLSNRPNLLTKP